MQKYAVAQRYVSSASICIYMYKICKICKDESHMQNMQKYALPTLLMLLIKL